MIDLRGAHLYDAQRFVTRAIETRLLLLPETRRLVVRLLGSPEPAGMEYIDEKGDLKLKGVGGGNSYLRTGPLKTTELAPGVELPLTEGDRFTNQLSSPTLGLPPFEIWSSPEKRSSQKQQIGDYLLDDSRDWMEILKKSPFFEARQGG